MATGASTSARELVAMQLGQAVDGLIEEVGARMLEAVPARVVGRITEPEVGSEVDDRGPAGDEVRDDPGGRAVGQGQEHRIHGREPGPHGQSGRGEVGVMAADRLVLSIATGQSHDLDVRDGATTGGPIPRRRSPWPR